MRNLILDLNYSPNELNISTALSGLAGERNTSLSLAHRQHHGHINHSDVAVDDIVIVHSEDLHVPQKLGLVKELVTGRDGKVRGAILPVSTGNLPSPTMYPLEVPHPPHEEPADENESQLTSLDPDVETDVSQDQPDEVVPMAAPR